MMLTLVLCKRDTKNLYEPALRGDISDVVGVDIPFPRPTSPDMVVDNGTDGLDHAKIAAGILRRIKEIGDRT